MKKNQTFAAIDLGSNSCRLSVFDAQGKELINLSEKVRLSEGMHLTDCVTTDALKRATDCFSKFNEIMKQNDVGAYRAVATAAMRRAKNASEVVDMIKEKSSIKLEVISGEEEAKLTLMGAISVADKSKKNVVVFDSGGGSTEIVLATNEANPKIIHSISIPLGSRNVSENYGLAEYSEKNAHNLRSDLDKYINQFKKDAGFEKYADSICLIGTSSSPLRLAASQHPDKYEKYHSGCSEGEVIQKETIPSLVKGFYAKTTEELAQSPYVGENRKDIFIPSCLIFEKVSTSFAEDVFVTRKGVSHGLEQEYQNSQKKTLNNLFINHLNKTRI